ncbi:MAG: imidazolonepropionase [Thermoleophilia bacterium]
MGAACDLLLRGAGELVTMSTPRGLGVVPDGALAARGGRIIWAGAEADLMANVDVPGDALVIDAEGACVLPGFVDAHTHLVFGGERSGEYAARLGGAGYLEIQAAGGGIMATVRGTRAASLEQLSALAHKRLDSFVRCGTTTLEAKTGYGLSLDDERRMLQAAKTPHATRRVHTLLAAHSTPEEYAGRDDEYISLVCGEILPALAAEARFVDVFCDQGAFTVSQSRRVLEAGAALGLRVKMHAEELAHTGGAALAAELGAVSADHLIFASAADIAAFAAGGTSAVLLPGTSYTLGMPYAPARAMLEAGVNVALATDFNPGTCYCENLQVVISLACQQMRLTPDEAVYAATVGGARALGLEAEAGSLEVGKRCDFILLDAQRHEELPYHFGVNLVTDVVIGGALAVAGGAVIAGGVPQ